MKTLDDVIIKADQLDSLMYAIEGQMLQAADDEGGEGMLRLHNLFYLLWDQLKQISADITEVNGHIKVCNTILAMNHVEDLKAEIGILKQGHK